MECPCHLWGLNIIWIFMCALIIIYTMIWDPIFEDFITTTHYLLNKCDLQLMTWVSTKAGLHQLWIPFNFFSITLKLYNILFSVSDRAGVDCFFFFEKEINDICFMVTHTWLLMDVSIKKKTIFPRSIQKKIFQTHHHLELIQLNKACLFFSFINTFHFIYGHS